MGPDDTQHFTELRSNSLCVFYKTNYNRHSDKEQKWINTQINDLKYNSDCVIYCLYFRNDYQKKPPRYIWRFPLAHYKR